MDIAFHLPMWILWVAGGIGVLLILFLACFGVIAMMSLMKMRW